MPVEGLDYFICVMEKESAHLSLVSRLPSQIVLKSYQNIKFDESLLNILNSKRFLQELADNIKSQSGPGQSPRVIISYPTSYGYMDEFKTVTGLSNDENTVTGEMLLETATCQQKSILNYQIHEKDKSGKWIFAIAKRFTKPIRDQFLSNNITIQSIILNSIANANFIEAIAANNTAVFIDSTTSFYDTWFWDGQKQKNEWRMISKNADFSPGYPGISNKIVDFIQHCSKEYETMVEKVFYTGIKENNEIKQLFSKDNTYNLLEADISGLCTLSPEVEDKFGFKGNESFLVKIAGTALS